MAKQNENRVKPAETELKDKLVQLNRVAKVTKGGRTFSFAAIVVVGDGNGTVGHGLGKARDVSEAITKAADDAKKNLVKVPIYKGTIPHEVLGKFKAGKVLLADFCCADTGFAKKKPAISSSKITVRLVVMLGDNFWSLCVSSNFYGNCNSFNLLPNASLQSS